MLLEFALLEFVVVVVTLALIQATGLGAYAAFFAGVISAAAAALGTVVFRSGIEKRMSGLLAIVIVLAAALTAQAMVDDPQVSVLTQNPSSYQNPAHPGLTN